MPTLRSIGAGIPAGEQYGKKPARPVTIRLHKVWNLPSRVAGCSTERSYYPQLI